MSQQFGTMVVPNRNIENTIFASAVYTATQNGIDQTNPGALGVVVVIDATLDAALASVVFKIQGKDPASGKYYDILESTAVASVTTRILRVHPAHTASANLIAKDMIPRTWRVIATHADADAITYSVGYSLVS